MLNLLSESWNQDKFIKNKLKNIIKPTFNKFNIEN
jgi:hypothetical protein